MFQLLGIVLLARDCHTGCHCFLVEFPFDGMELQNKGSLSNAGSGNLMPLAVRVVVCKW